jgi:6-phosphogluconolactonase
VAVHDSPKPPPDRVSLTFEALNRSDRVWFLVSGADKAEAVGRGVAGAPPEQSSAAQVRGSDETIWFVDEAAAADL